MITSKNDHAQGVNTPEEYEVKEDVYNELPDGRLEQVAGAGARMSIEQAEKLGLTKSQIKHVAGPSETKPDAPSEVGPTVTAAETKKTKATK